MTRHRRVTRQEKIKYKLPAQKREEDYEFSSKIQTTQLIKPLNKHQRDYIDSIRKNVVTFCLGVSGTSKTIIAVSEAVKHYNDDNSPINKIYYLRSNIGISHSKDLGFVPGDLSEKVLQLAYPILDNLVEFMSEGQAKYLITSNKIEVLPINMIRGRSFKNSFIILDESANCTEHHIKTVLTRISEGSKMVIVGDYGQIDFEDTTLSGFRQVVNKLKDLDNIGVVEFTKQDIIRHPIIGDILERLN